MDGFFKSWHPIFDVFFVTFFLVCLQASHVTGNSSSSWLFLSGCKYHHLFTTPLLLDIPFLLQAELCRSDPRQTLDPGPTSQIQIASQASWHLFLLCFLVPTGFKVCLNFAVTCPCGYAHGCLCTCLQGPSWGCGEEITTLVPGKWPFKDPSPTD